MESLKFIIFFFTIFQFSYLEAFEDNNLKLEPRITFGRLAEKNQFPFSVYLRVKYKFRCGGSILNKNYILTSAHCTTDNVTQVPVDPQDILVYVGTLKLEKFINNYEVIENIVHENYRKVAINDIALLKMKIQFEYTESIQPIRIFENSVIPNSAKILAIGWGSEDIYGKKPSDYLRWTEIKQCSYRLPIEDLICFENVQESVPCYGDSGSAAIFADTNIVIGISAVGHHVCKSELPFAYTSLAYHKDWIYEKIKN